MRLKPVAASGRANNQPQLVGKMIGLDTNILVRYLTQDDAAQSRKASRIIEQRLSPDEPGFLSLVTMVETVWVLKTRYRMRSAQIAMVIERILAADSLQVQNEQQVFEAMVALKSGVGTFADALVAALGAWAGCSSTLTFDERAVRLNGFRLAD